MAFNPLLNAVDFVLMQGQRSPGLATVARAGSPRKWDERGGYGISGSFSLYLGRRLAHFDLILRLYTNADWDAWEAWKHIVDRPPFGKRPKAIDIWHPWLESLDIKSVGVEDVLQPEELDNGGYSITIQLIEWRQPKLTLAKPEESKPQKSTDPVDLEIEKLASQVNELAKG